MRSAIAGESLRVWRILPESFESMNFGLPNKKLKRLIHLLVGGLLVLSLALNIFLWSRLSSQRNQLKSAQTSASEIDELRRQNQELQMNRTSASDSASANARELARLRNEVGQLRKQAGEVAALRAQALDAALLRAQLAAATQNLARAERALADATKLSPEELQQVQSVQCVNNLKQIGLAARIWATDNNNIFPPDFISMSNELATPKILLCPADAGGIRVGGWLRLDPSRISYRFLTPNVNASDPAKPLATCVMHGHTVWGDGTVAWQ